MDGLTRHSSEEDIERKERKREQNRLAQRTYRRNQKRRIQTLEAAIAKSTITAGNDDVEVPSIDLENTDSTSTMLPSSQQSQSKDSGSRRGSSPEDLVAVDYMAGLSGELSSDIMFGDGRTALHRAICIENGPIAILLLDQGADIAARDNQGHTPLHLAADKGSGAMLKLLLERLADPEAVDYQGRTALFSAVSSGSATAVELLLVAEVNIDRKDIWGKVALHVAVEKGVESVVRILLEHGADVNA